MLTVPVSACQPMGPGCAAVWRSYCWLTAVLVAPFGCFRARDCLRCEAGVAAAAPACAFVISKAGGRRRGHTQGGAAQLLTALHPTCAWCSSTDESFCPNDVRLPWLTHMRLSFLCCCCLGLALRLASTAPSTAHCSRGWQGSASHGSVA